MKKISIAILALCLALPFALAAAEREQMADARLDDEARREGLQLLGTTARDAIERAAALSDEAWSFKPAPDRWSVGEVIEHLMLVEGIFLGGIEEAMAAAPDPEWATKTAGKEERIRALFPNRERKFEAPPRVQPSGERGRREIVQGFLQARHEIYDLLRDAEGPLRAHLAEHPALGTLDVYQWAIAAALHNARHNEQIAEIITDPKFPK